MRGENAELHDSLNARAPRQRDLQPVLGCGQCTAERTSPPAQHVRVLSDCWVHAT
jgi:hypothetical protein